MVRCKIPSSRLQNRVICHRQQRLLRWNAVNLVTHSLPSKHILPSLGKICDPRRITLDMSPEIA